MVKPQTEVEAALPPQWFLDALACPGRSALVDANGARLHYLGWNLDDVTKPVLLLLHGFRAHGHWWDWTAPHLANAFRVVAPDLSGMGDSTHRGTYDADTFATDVLSFLDAAQLYPVIAIGHSYGGSTLLRACNRRPELFSRLILLDTALPLSDEAVHPPPLPLAVANICYPDHETAIARFTLRPRQPVCLPYARRHIAYHSACQDADGWHWKFDPAAQPFDHYRFDADRLLANIARPVDFVRAEFSSVTSPARAAILAEALRRTVGREMVVIPAAHHHMMLDQPIALIDVLRTLLGNGD